MAEAELAAFPIVPPASGPILVVEDNIDTSRALVLILNLRGYEAVTAYDGLDALTHLRAGLRPSVMILDLAMPNMDGHMLLAELPAFGPIPVVVYSACPQSVPVPADTVAARVPKGQDPDVLLAVIARLCAQTAAGA